MGAIIAVAVCAAIFFAIYKIAGKTFFGEEETKDWPKTEGTILESRAGVNGTEFNIEFWDGNRQMKGRTIQYLGKGGGYETGEKVMIRYHVFPKRSKTTKKVFDGMSLELDDAIIVFENPKVISVEANQIKRAWLWLLPVIGLVIFDVVLIIQYILQI